MKEQEGAESKATDLPGPAPFVPAGTELPEFTPKALAVGLALAVILGAANAYLGMKVGLTVAATFPAAVVAMAVLRPFKGTVLEENLARTVASVGEALVAGAIFTLPAFVLAGVWKELKFFDSALIMLVGGVMGVLFVALLRRTMVEEKELAFPESVACAEVVKAGQKGATGAGLLFGAMGFSALWEFLKNGAGLNLVKEQVSTWLAFPAAKVGLGGKAVSMKGGLVLSTPSASSAVVGVGFIVGPRLATIAFTGGLFAWGILTPLGNFLLSNTAPAAGGEALMDWSSTIWQNVIRPFAVGAMIVSAFWTLWGLRKSLVSGLGRSLKDVKAAASGGGGAVRTEKDLDIRIIAGALAVLAVPLVALYWYFTKNLAAALVLGAVMMVIGFFFVAVAGYLVGLIGSSNNPISGLTLSSLILAALLMLALGVTGSGGVLAVLAVAGVVCCACGVGGDMIQDLKVGHILGGTPWKMEIGENLGVILAALALVIPISLLMTQYKVGSPQLPAPQAGLMAMMAKGIVGGEMAWFLVFTGALFAVTLILIGAPAPMLIAVGMYLPLGATFAIFVGGLIKLVLDLLMKRRSRPARVKAENTGILLASGLVAGEALTAVVLAALLIARSPAPGEPQALVSWGAPSGALGLLVFPVLGILLVSIPWWKARGAGAGEGGE